MSEVADLAEKAMAGEVGQARIFDLKVNYISGFEREEELQATAHVVHAGRRTVVTECQIKAGARLVATATATFAVTSEKEN